VNPERASETLQEIYAEKLEVVDDAASSRSVE